MNGKVISEGGQGITLPADTQVLLVEPQKFQADILRNALTGAGIPVDNIFDARNKEEATEVLKNTRPDIVLMEMEYPDGKGEDLIRDMRDGGVRAPILAVSAHGESERVQSAVAAGVNDYLLKPVSNDQITKRVARHLRQSLIDDMPPPSRPAAGRMNSL